MLLTGHWLVDTIIPAETLYIINCVLVILFLLIVLYSTLIQVMRDKTITINTLCGAIIGYLFIGLLWTMIYTLIFITNHHAFAIDIDLAKYLTTTPQHFIYYSYVTLSTLGYGDITPLSNPAKTFAWIEAITGQIYLTIWIAHLVGMYIAQKNTRK